LPRTSPNTLRGIRLPASKCDLRARSRCGFSPSTSPSRRSSRAA
jgi:hypothetical protein